MTRLVHLVRNFFSDGHERTLKARKNVVYSLLFKGLAMALALLNVPLAIHYVNSTQYGIWLTLSSLFTWFSMFDIGFGNGLKNKLTEALSKRDIKLARAYISTTYAAVTVISILLFAIFLIINFFLDWTAVLNVPHAMKGELSLIVVIIFSVFSVQFILQLINIVSQSKQNTIIPALISVTGNLAGLILLLIFTHNTQGSLLNLCLTIGVTPVLTLAVFSVILFKGTFKDLAPSFRLADRHYIREIMNLGIKFFIIQIGLIFYYNCDNLIITQVMGPAAVTPYNLSIKYFSVISLFSNILMTPFWAAFIEASVRKDHEWIKGTVRHLEKICLGLFAVSLLMVALSPFVYRLWLGTEVTVPLSLSACVAVYTSLNTYRTIFNFYMNGAGKIMLQLYLVIFSGIGNILLGIYLCRRLGVEGVLLSTILFCLVSAVFEIIQYRKLINNTATGLWNK